MVADEIAAKPELGLEIVGFVDDSEALAGRRVAGHPVLGTSADIAALVASHAVDVLLLALPSVSGERIRELAKICAATPAEVRIVPGLREIILGDVSWRQIRAMQPEDLLGREAVELEPAAAGRSLRGRRVLVTGAGGSIGSELCRWAARSRVERILLLGHAENELFELEEELNAEFPAVSTRSLVADIRDRARLERLFCRYLPEFVFHAAAHKHVPLMEENPEEAIKTNVFGTVNVVAATRACGAERMVMLSTDKAVRPVSIMGASKRLAEMILQHAAKRGGSRGPRLSMVRFGNVLGSRGSVVPRFQRQIERGGPVTVSDPKARRYFMTIREAALLVVLAGSQARGGEVFVLDMGQQLSILELAQQMIALSGRRIAIEITGLRPGEKLIEDLWTTEFAPTEIPKVYLAAPGTPAPAILAASLQSLRDATAVGDEDAIRVLLGELLPEFPRRSPGERAKSVAREKPPAPASAAEEPPS
jgi:FlaA1/EpsC-like NDP-sugar epimerase